MGISLFDIIATTINFFVLLFILQKLFYSPVSKIMEERQQKIEENINNAERKNEEAQQLIHTYEMKVSEIEREKTETMNEVLKEAEEYKRSLVEKYRKEAEDKKSGFLMEVKDDKDAIGAEIRSFMAKGTVDITRNLVDSFERENLESYLFDALLKKVKTFADENPDKGKKEEARRFVLISTSKVEERRKEQLEYVLQDNGFEVSSLEVREDPSLVAGYMLKIPDHIIYSSISHFLDKKEVQLKDFLDQVARDRGEEYDA